MPINLLAICKQPHGLILKRVKVTADVQSQLEGVFIQQEQMFMEGITQEIPFDGGWSPESNELMYMALTTDAAAIFAEAQGNVVALPEINAQAFAEENICALAVLMSDRAEAKLLLQGFSSLQSLERRFSLILDGDTFNKITEPAFTLGASLTGVIHNGLIKFKKYSSIN